MHESTARKRRFRHKRREAHLKAYEVWLPETLVDELRRPDESMSTLVSRALDTLKHGESIETSHGTSHTQAVGSSPELKPLQRKAALVARLQAMRANGLKLQAIATQLNAEGVPTISGRGHWQAGTVGNLLNE
jgi:hypothetical protein